ncbi:hypothetical protein AB0L62_07935 [Nocardia asteroides]|uniref:hypothetical protein n=1 Tax=Nocardia asteroides TaxID=1824 RepID=UPI003447E6CE
MSFPKGNFTITNNDTGRCVRAQLGTVHDASYHVEGQKYLQTVTDRPWLHLGEPDGSISTAWYFKTTHDGVERAPYDQIVNVAVGDLQNIGDFCVWFTAGEKHHRQEFEEEAKAVAEARANRSEARKRYLEDYIDSIVPKQWDSAQKTLDNWEFWCWAYATRKEQCLEDRFWNDYDNHGRGKYRGDKDALIEAIKTYNQEAAKDGVYIPSPWVTGSASSRLDGCGRSRYRGTTYRWATDGTHIFAADSTTVNHEQTYWTDSNGFLVGRVKGQPGQSWTFKAWTPPVADERDNTADALLLTGLFGPLGAVLSGR